MSIEPKKIIPGGRMIKCEIVLPAETQEIIDQAAREVSMTQKCRHCGSEMRVDTSHMGGALIDCDKCGHEDINYEMPYRQRGRITLRCHCAGCREMKQGTLEEERAQENQDLWKKYGWKCFWSKCSNEKVRVIAISSYGDLLIESPRHVFDRRDFPITHGITKHEDNQYWLPSSGLDDLQALR